jgi:hypothetical protein
MIVVELMGGLGNQMFQYALGRHLAEKYQTELKLDLRFLLDRTPRKSSVFRDYDLSIFPIEQNFLTEGEAALLLNGKSEKPFQVVKEKKIYYFDAEVLKSPDNIYLRGFWQNEKYFKDIEDIIRKEFVFQQDWDSETNALAEHIKAVSAVCLNVRRGDYVSIPTARKWHGLCGPDYYQEAVFFTSEKVVDPQFFIFSDDITWCKRHFICHNSNLRIMLFKQTFSHFGILNKRFCRISYPTAFLSKKHGQNKFRDFYLMSLCKHFIIPNSTFGWWAAWLCPNPDKIVIAPKKWVRAANIDASDVTPSSWLRM